MEPHNYLQIPLPADTDKLVNDDDINIAQYSNDDNDEFYHIAVRPVYGWRREWRPLYQCAAVVMVLLLTNAATWKIAQSTATERASAVHARASSSFWSKLSIINDLLTSPYLTPD